MKIKEKFESIDQNKLSDSQKEILSKIKSATKDFTIEDEKSIQKVDGALDNIIDKLRKSNPDAIKEEPKKEEPKKAVEVKEKKTRTKTQKSTPKGKTTKAKTPKEPKSGKRTVFSLAKEIRKSDESWEDAKSRAKKIMEQEKEGITKKMKSETEKLLAFIKRRKELEGLSGTTISKDAKIQALPKGRRISKNGKVYYENRDNRTDRLAPSFQDKIYLADGGGVGKNYNIPEKATHVLQIDGQNWYLEKIDSTHFYMSNSPDFRGMANHVGQHRGEPYYNEIRQWLKDTFANGGFTPDVSDGTQFMDGVYADGGFVSKGQMVWNKLTSSKRADFLKEYFTPEITPRSQEILVGKTYKFLPRNVKIKIEAIYANVEDYANGGGVEDDFEEVIDLGNNFDIRVKKAFFTSGDSTYGAYLYYNNQLFKYFAFLSNTSKKQAIDNVYEYLETLKVSDKIIEDKQLVGEYGKQKVIPEYKVFYNDRGGEHLRSEDSKAEIEQFIFDVKGVTKDKIYLADGGGVEDDFEEVIDLGNNFDIRVKKAFFTSGDSTYGAYLYYNNQLFKYFAFLSNTSKKQAIDNVYEYLETLKVSDKIIEDKQLVGEYGKQKVIPEYKVFYNDRGGEHLRSEDSKAEIEQFIFDVKGVTKDKIYLADGGGVDDSVIDELWSGYASAVLFTEIDSDTGDPLDIEYSIYDFDEETETSTKKMLAEYYSQNKSAIEESELDLDTIGNDIWYTRSGQGAGFFDHNLDSEVEERLTKGAKALGEFPSVETYEGKISVRGGRVFADGGVMIGIPETPLARGLGMDYTGLVGETSALSSGEMFAKGGGIPNNYDGKYHGDIWDKEWTNEQKYHFLSDHKNEIGFEEELYKESSLKRATKRVKSSQGNDMGFQLIDSEKLTNTKFSELPRYVKFAFQKHIREGQYVMGGNLSSGRFKFNIGDKVMIDDSGYVKSFTEFDLSKPAEIIDRSKTKMGGKTYYFYKVRMADGRTAFNQALEKDLKLVEKGNSFSDGGFMTDPNFGDFQNTMFASGGFVGKNEFNIGDIVWQKDEKRYGTVINNYGDPINGDGGEIRLSTTGNTVIFTYNKDFTKRTGYNLVKLGEKGDTGKFTTKVLDEMKESANRLIDYRKKSKDKEGVAYYQEVYKRLLDGEFDSLERKGYADGGGTDSKLEAGVYRVGKPIKVRTNLYAQKIVEVFDNGDIATASDYGRSLSDFKSMQYPTISKEQLDSMYMYGGDFFKKGGALLSTRERYVAELKGLTGLRQNAIDDFIDENQLTDNEILNIVIGLGRKQISAGSVSTAIVGAKGNSEFKKIIAFAKSDKALREYKEGGRVVNIVNEDKEYSEEKYQGIFGDYDGDGVSNINDLNPLDKTKVGRVDNIEIDETFKKLIDLKNDLDVKMYEALEELDKKAPKNAEFYARTKTPYSIVKKLVDKRLLDPKKGLTDLIGTTVVVSNQKELEKVKNDLDNGLMGEVLDFDDFYTNPNNGYRAYHYIVLFKGTPIEVQLKTKMQKQLNEVSHEFYKKGTLNAKGLNEVSEMIMKADKGDKKAQEEVKILLANEGELAKKISIENYAMGGGLDNHGLKEGDQIIKTMSGGVQKVKTKSGDIVYVDLANGYRGDVPPLPFAKGGRLKSALMRDRNNFNHFEKHEIAYSKDKPNRKGYGYADGGMMGDDGQMPKLNLGKHKND